MREDLQQFIDQPVSALVLCGDEASTRQSAVKIIRGLLSGKRSPDALHTVERERESITIEAVRDLKQFARSKPTDNNPIRIIHIPAADLMTEPAQNALLKILEEPGQGITFIMEASNEGALLPTVRSRSHLYYVQSKQQSTITDADRTVVREYLQADTYTRLCLHENYAKDRKATLQFLDSLLHATKSAMNKTAKESRHDALAQWLSRSDIVLEAAQIIKQNAQIRLALDCMALQLV